jgi:ATP-dependent DNA helicase Rep
MAYFRLIVNPDDDNAFLRVINVPRREIGSTTLEKLGNYATERKISMYAATEKSAWASTWTRFTDRLSRFKRFMDKVREQCAGEDPIAPCAAWSWTSTTRTGCAPTAPATRLRITA